jgi:hypothetical protein
MQEVTHTYWVLRHPDTTGDAIARFDTGGGFLLPDTISEYDDFVVESVADRQALTATTVDQSGLTDSEKQRIRDVFPIL